MKKTLPLIALLGIALFPASGAESNQHWAVGVSESGGWYDADKTFNGDKDLCWAAAASNVIAWWQDQNPELAKAAAAPTGDDVWSTVTSSFNNISGYPIEAFTWYYSGELSDNTIRASLTTYGQESGGVYSDFLEGEPGYKLSSIMGLLQYDFRDAKVYTSVLCDLLDSGYGIAIGIAGAIKGSSGAVTRYGHAITLWGAEVDPETGILSKIWITDSDDGVGGQSKGLVSLTCSLKEDSGSSTQYITFESDTLTNGQKLYPLNEAVLDQFWAVNSKVTSWTAPEDILAPEPATSTLSLLALAGLCARRRRK